MTILHTTRIAAALAGCCMLVSGCKARELGIKFADSQADKVDASWIAAARTCWPALAHNDYSRPSIAHNLADPIHFRATFGSYAAMTDSEIEAAVVKPINAAGLPDSSTLRDASGATITRAQAVQFDGNPPANLESSSIPADALCAIHSGTPVGF